MKNKNIKTRTELANTSVSKIECNVIAQFPYVYQLYTFNKYVLFYLQAANLRRHQLKNCRGRPSLKTIMKNLNKKNAGRLTKVEETFDVPEPVTILPLAEPDGNHNIKLFCYSTGC